MKLVSIEDEAPVAAKPAEVSVADKDKKAKANPEYGWLKDTLGAGVGAGASYLGQDFAVGSWVADQKEKGAPEKDLANGLGAAAVLEGLGAIVLGYIAFKHVDAGTGRYFVLGLSAGLFAGALVNGIDAYNHLPKTAAEAAMGGAYQRAAGQA